MEILINNMIQTPTKGSNQNCSTQTEYSDKVQSLEDKLNKVDEHFKQKIYGQS